MEIKNQGGQQIGQLVAYKYSLFAADDSSKALGKGSLSQAIPGDGTVPLKLDWADTAGALEPGDYYVRIAVEDRYDESQVHPLMVNYQDSQVHHVRFTVEE